MAAPMEQQDQTNLNPNPTNELWRRHPNLELVSNYIRNVRDCDYYKEEYKECTSWRGRFHQRYVYGESIECDQFNNAYKACKLAKGEEGNAHMMDYVIRYELSKRDFRVESAISNDIWEYRKTPLKSWKYPGVQREDLPEDCEEEPESHPTEVKGVTQVGQTSPDNTRVDNSTQDDKAQMMDSQQTQALAEKKSSSGCVVS